MNKTTPETSSLLPWIGKTAKFMDYYISDFMKCQGVDISKEQFIVLKYLHEKDGRIQNDLAFITNRSKTALTRLINTMEKKGLLYRSASSTDMRVNHIYLTDLGRETWEKSHPLILKITNELQKGISEEELLVTKNVLKQIQQNINIKTKINH